MARKRTTVDQRLQKAGLRAIKGALEILPKVRAPSNETFLSFPIEQRNNFAWCEEVVEYPKKLEGYVPLGMPITRPADARATGFTYRRLNPEEPFRRFEEVQVTYKVQQKGKPPKIREVIYYKQRSENLETLESLAKYSAELNNPAPSVKRAETESVYRYSQWEGALFEFNEYKAHLELLKGLEESLGDFGAALLHIIRYHGEMAYHLGLQVREAELRDFQSKAAAVRRGGKEGGSKRAEAEAMQAKKWQDAFARWLRKAVEDGTVKKWSAKHRMPGQQERSNETLYRYAFDNWPDGGFGGGGKKDHMKECPSPRVLHRVIKPLNLFGPQAP